MVGDGWQISGHLKFLSSRTASPEARHSVQLQGALEGCASCTSCSIHAGIPGLPCAFEWHITCQYLGCEASCHTQKPAPYAMGSPACQHGILQLQVWLRTAYAPLPSKSTSMCCSKFHTGLVAGLAWLRYPSHASSNPTHTAAAMRHIHGAGP